MPGQLSVPGAQSITFVTDAAMIRLALMFVVLVSLVPADAWAFGLPLDRSKEKLEAEDCPSTIRQAQKLGKKDAGKFSSMHPLGTWGGFYGTGKDRMRKCSAFMKKAYMEAARKNMSKKTKTRKHFSPKRSLAR
jgi:hypothetical protein